MKHKWHKEIKAWADGAEIEWRWAILIDGKYDNWRPFCKENKLSFFEEGIEYRIKPQPVEPQYLYVYKHEGNGISFGYKPHAGTNMWQTKVIGKIKLENDN